MPKRYTNLNQVSNKKTPRELLRWMLERRSKVKDFTVQIPHFPKNSAAVLKENKTNLTYTWIGHSTFLIQVNGLNLITDPVWAERMGFQKRLTEPGLTFEELPYIDAVLISHGHFDHLDFPSIRRLPGRPRFFVPTGLKKLFLQKGYSNVTELNWWEHEELGEIGLHFVPAQHWTRRSLFDMNTSHWGGWVIESSAGTLYFVGDSGYFSGFKEIGARYSIDVVFMPIGAYEPEWFMADSHISPEDSVRAYLDLQAKQFVPMHYGAYRLADDTGPEALERLYKAWDSRALPQDQLKVLKIGETAGPTIQ